MSKADHLAKAKEFIAKGDDYYRKAGEEIVAAMREDPSLTQPQVAERIGKSLSWVERTLRALREGRAVDHQSGSNKRDEVARKVLRDADEATVEEIVAELPAKQLDKLATAATNTLVNRHRAEQAEHSTEPTVGTLMGNDKFDPSEFWADTVVIRVNRNARELANLIQRAGGLLYGSMTPDEAFEYLHEAEGLIAEARAAAQEQVRDGVNV